MAGYVIGSQKWMDITKERIITLGDLLKSPLTTAEEKERLHLEQSKLVLMIFDYFEGKDNTQH